MRERSTRTDRPPGRLDEVVAAAVDGSTEAFETLYRELAGSVTRYLRMNGVPDPASSANEVFVRAFSRLSSFQGGEAAFRSWLFAIAHNRMIDERRNASRRPKLELDDTSVERMEAGDVEEEALGVLGGDRVQALLQLLSPDQRDVVLLRVMADLSIDDVARILGKRPGAIKALLHRALASLRRHLEREGGGR